MLAQRITALVYGVLSILVISQGAVLEACFSTNTFYREQMKAVFAGRLALSAAGMAKRPGGHARGEGGWPQ